MTQCQWITKVWRSFCTSESNFRLVSGPFIEISIIFISSNSFSPLGNAPARSSHRLWPRNKDVQYRTVTLFSSSFQYHTWKSISLFCMLSFRDSSYKTDINGDFKISSKIICLKCGNEPWLIKYYILVLPIWNFNDTGSTWHIRLRTSPKSSTELLLKPLFTYYIHTRCASTAIPSINGKWIVCITAILEEQMMK